MTNKDSIWTPAYWRAVAERALWTAAQVATLYVGADVLENGFDVRSFDWAELAAFAAGGAFLSVVKGLAANAITGTGPALGSTSETVTEDETPFDDVPEHRNGNDEDEG